MIVKKLVHDGGAVGGCDLCTRCDYDEEGRRMKQSLILLEGFGHRKVRMCLVCVEELGDYLQQTKIAQSV